MIMIRRALPVAFSLAFVLAACGGSSDGGADVAETTPGTEAPTDDTEDFTEVDSSDSVATDQTVATDPAEPAAPDTDTEPPAETDPVAEPTDTEADPADSEGTTVDAAVGTQVSMVEWAIEAPTEYSAGDITFTATNNGSFPHEFVVIAGEGYESLPLAEGGAVIEDELPTGALIGRTGRLGGGSSEDLTVSLAPGNYVFVCNLGGGGNSHAGQGQRLDVTVS